MSDDSSPTLPYEATRKATIARVQKALSAYMKRNKLSVKEFNQNVLGVGKYNTAVYSWLAGRGLPGPLYVPKLCRAMHMGPAYFALPPGTQARPRTSPQAAAPEAATSGASAEAGELFGGAGSDLQEIVDATGNVTTPQPTAEPTPTVIVHARSPKDIAADRARRATNGALDMVEVGPALFLSYQGNADGTGTVVYTADRASAARVFRTLARKDET